MILKLLRSLKAKEREGLAEGGGGGELPLAALFK